VRGLAFALLLVAPFAYADDLINADRPGIADGSTTVGAHTFQIEIGAERDDRSTDHDVLVPTLLRYGLSSNFELRIESSVYQRIEGWAPVSLGAKYHFEDKPSLGLIGRVFFINTEDVTGDLRLANDFQVGDRWAFNPNIGLAISSGNGEHFLSGLAALTAQYNIAPTANVFADGGLTYPEERHGSAALLLDVGGAWIFRPDMQLDASVGWGAHGSTVPSVFWSAGISRRF
jgi:hypothetical protein